MRIDLANVAGTPGARGVYPVSEVLAPTEAYACVGPVSGELVVENIGSLLLVRGELDALIRLPCVRCLTEAELPIAMGVEEEFACEGTAPDVETVDRDEPAASAISDYVLDVTELVRQQIALHLPMAFICRPDCRGICPSCGKNLNEGPCGCRAEPNGARWAKLGDLLGKGRGAPDSRLGM